MTSFEGHIKEAITSVMAKLTHIDSHEFASQRTTADQIEHQARKLLIDTNQGFQPPRGTRQPGDIIYQQGNQLVHINIKSTDLSKKFHMPNLISSENLHKILMADQEFMILKFSHLDGQIQNWELWNIQDVDWAHLTFGALGTGQIQIRDALNPLTAWAGTRRSWRLCWKTLVTDFYLKEQNKIQKRLDKWQTRFNENS